MNKCKNNKDEGYIDTYSTAHTRTSDNHGIQTTHNSRTVHSTLCQLLIPFFAICTSATAVRDDVIFRGEGGLFASRPCCCLVYSGGLVFYRENEMSNQNVNSK
jgi:hypothetical protein